MHSKGKRIENNKCSNYFYTCSIYIFVQNTIYNNHSNIGITVRFFESFVSHYYLIGILLWINDSKNHTVIISHVMPNIT